MSALTFKRLAGPGAPRFSVWAGARPLGTISNPGPGAEGGSWHGLAPDGTRFSAASKPKIAEQLRRHAQPKVGAHGLR